MDKATADLLDKRGNEYGEAWKVTGQIVGTIHPQFEVFSGTAPEYSLAWMTILCKLIRALATPRNRDHWADIAGYAMLVANDIEALEKKNNSCMVREDDYGLKGKTG